MQWERRLQLAAVGLFLVAYSGLSHYSNSHAQTRDLATALALSPMIACGAMLAWRHRGARFAVLCAAGAALLGYLIWPYLTANFAHIYLAQQLGFHLLMCASFGLSLLAGRTPLCTRFADQLHGPLGPQEVIYTRRVTAAWSWFFAANAAATLLLWSLAPLRVWSIFVNFCSLPLIALMFVAEYAVRRRVLHQVRTGGLIATLRVYFAASR